MKNLMTLIVGAAITAAFGQGALAQSASAYDNANCHASFLDDCSVSSDSDAPLPLLGAGPLALAALGASIIIGRRRSRATAG